MATLDSAVAKCTGNDWDFDSLPRDPNNLIWGLIQDQCGLTLQEVVALQNEICRREGAFVLVWLPLTIIIMDLTTFSFVQDMRGLRSIWTAQ